MKRGRRAGVRVLLIAMLIAPVRASEPLRCGTGTFLQLRPADVSRASSEWAALFDGLQTLGVSTLVIQWSARGGTSFVRPADSAPAGAPSSVEQILDVADRRGFTVIVGLRDDTGFWTAIAKPDEAERFFAGTRGELERLLPDLAPLVARHRSFGGWYITEEVDDVNWRDQASRRILTEHLAALTSRLRRVPGPAVPIAISGFSNQAMDPDALASFWSTLLPEAGIDVLLFQDGIGTKKQTLATLPRYAAALYRGVLSVRRQIRIVTELFDQVDGVPVNDKPFAAVPAPFDRVRQQSSIASMYSTLPPMTFSAPDYMLPSAGAAASQLFQAYVASAHCPGTAAAPGQR